MTEVVTTGAEVIATGAQYAQQTGASRSYLIYVGVAILAMIIGHQLYVYLQNKKAQERLEQNPGAAKVYIKSTNLLVYQETLRVASVDGKAPVFFYENLGLTKGFYLTPGTHVINSTFTKVRPGVLHKQVSTTYEATDNEVEVKANESYNYSFSTSKEVYTLTLKK
jgi:hypothetical protein